MVLVEETTIFLAYRLVFVQYKFKHFGRRIFIDFQGLMAQQSTRIFLSTP